MAKPEEYRPCYHSPKEMFSRSLYLSSLFGFAQGSRQAINNTIEQDITGKAPWISCTTNIRISIICFLYDDQRSYCSVDDLDGQGSLNSFMSFKSCQILFTWHKKPILSSGHWFLYFIHNSMFMYLLSRPRP